MDRAKKEALVAELHETFETASLVVLTHQQGLTVSEVSDLRAKMREQGVGYKVPKNKLAKIALDTSVLRPSRPPGRRFASPRM